MNQSVQSTQTDPAFDLRYLSNLMPMSQLDQARLEELSKHIQVKTLPAGTTLFERGTQNNIVFYLLSGEIELKVNSISTTLEATSPQARQPIDPHSPRHFTATTKSQVHIIAIERDLLDIFVTPDQRHFYDVRKIRGHQPKKNDDLDILLKSKIFQMIPPVNLQVLLKRFEEIKVKKNQIIFRQDSVGDYFYLIKSGSCAILRYESPEDGWHVIADLVAGAGFGEQALISNKPRNATVMMSSDGVLLRLSRDDFDQLIKTPVVKTVDYKKSLELVSNGVLVVDVREEAEPAELNFTESIKIPMSQLRNSIEKIPSGRPLLVYSSNEHRSACAAYILIAHGFEVLVVKSNT